MEVFEQVLQQPPGYLRYGPGHMSLAHYPKQASTADNADRTGLGLHEHSDATLFTLLVQRTCALQVKDTKGRWQTTPGLSGNELLVLPGDWMEIFSNGQHPAARHRVMDTPYARSSIAFFQGLHAMQIAPLGPFVSAENPACYPSVDSDIQYAGGKSGVPRWRTHYENLAQSSE